MESPHLDRRADFTTAFPAVDECDRDLLHAKSGFAKSDLANGLLALIRENENRLPSRSLSGSRLMSPASASLFR